MQVEHSILVQAPAQRIFRLCEAVPMVLTKVERDACITVECKSLAEADRPPARHGAPRCQIYSLSLRR